MTITIGQTESLLISDLKVDQSYQRTINHKFAKYISENFNEDAFGTLIVGRREDGSLWVVDGQTRLEALKLLGKTRIVCRVFKSEGRAHEARVFKIINKDRKGMAPLIVFRACLLAEEEETVQLNKLVNQLGFIIPEHNTNVWPNLVCIKAVEATFRRRNGEAVLTETLKVIKECWTGEADALHRYIIEGLSYFIVKFEGQYRYKRLKTVLKKIKPTKLAGDAEAGKELFGGTRVYAVGRVVFNLYNKRIKDKLTWGDEND